MVINNLDGPPLLLSNVNVDYRHWVELQLPGGPKSPRDAIGASVYLTAGGMLQRGDVSGVASHLSLSDMCLHFGLTMRQRSILSRFTGLVGFGKPLGRPVWTGSTRLT